MRSKNTESTTGASIQPIQHVVHIFESSRLDVGLDFCLRGERQGLPEVGPGNTLENPQNASKTRGRRGLEIGTEV